MNQPQQPSTSAGLYNQPSNQECGHDYYRHGINLVPGPLPNYAYQSSGFGERLSSLPVGATIEPRSRVLPPLPAAGTRGDGTYVPTPSPLPEPFTHPPPELSSWSFPQLPSLPSASSGFNYSHAWSQTGGIRNHYLSSRDVNQIYRRVPSRNYDNGIFISQGQSDTQLPQDHHRSANSTRPDYLQSGIMDLPSSYCPKNERPPHIGRPRSPSTPSEPCSHNDDKKFKDYVDQVATFIATDIRRRNPRHYKPIPHVLIEALEDQDCPICYTKFDTSSPENIVEQPVRLGCGHVFGSCCLEKWLLMQEEWLCPYCRLEIEIPSDPAYDMDLWQKYNQTKDTLDPRKQLDLLRRVWDSPNRPRPKEPGLLLVPRPKPEEPGLPMSRLWERHERWRSVPRRRPAPIDDSDSEREELHRRRRVRCTSPPQEETPGGAAHNAQNEGVILPTSPQSPIVTRDPRPRSGTIVYHHQGT